MASIYILGDKKQNQIIKKFSKYDLTNKKNMFLDWSEEILNINREKLNNLIEKVTIWYEFKYSNNDLKNLFEKNISVYNFSYELLLKKLANDEKELLKSPKFNDLNIINKRIRYINLTENGIIKNIGSYQLDLRNFIGHPIKKLYDELVNNNMEEKSDVKKIIDDFNNKKLFRIKFFDNVMYRLIEKGGSTYGVERSYLFALENDRDFTFPLKYYDNTENLLHSKNFINDYLKHNGSESIICCKGYFYKNIRELPLSDYINWLKEITNENKTHAKILKFKKEI